MKSTNSMNLPFEFDSPVEFVLVGIEGKKRAVVAKSKEARIDLVAYAQRHSVDEDYSSYRGNKFPFPFPVRMQFYPLAVDSPPVHFPSNQIIDDRPSEFTLVWRGAASSYHKMRITKEFATRTNDIVEAVETQSAAQLEWALSSVIDRCHRANVELRRRQLWIVSAFWFTMLVYVIVLVQYFVIRFPLN